MPAQRLPIISQRPRYRDPITSAGRAADLLDPTIAAITKGGEDIAGILTSTGALIDTASVELKMTEFEDNLRSNPEWGLANDPSRPEGHVTNVGAAFDAAVGPTMDAAWRNLPNTEGAKLRAQYMGTIAAYRGRMTQIANDRRSDEWNYRLNVRASTLIDLAVRENWSSEKFGKMLSHDVNQGIADGYANPPKIREWHGLQVGAFQALKYNRMLAEGEYLAVEDALRTRLPAGVPNESSMIDPQTRSSLLNAATAARHADEELAQTNNIHMSIAEGSFPEGELAGLSPGEISQVKVFWMGERQDLIVANVMDYLEDTGGTQTASDYIEGLARSGVDLVSKKTLIRMRTAIKKKKDQIKNDGDREDRERSSQDRDQIMLAYQALLRGQEAVKPALTPAEFGVAVEALRTRGLELDERDQVILNRATAGALSSVAEFEIENVADGLAEILYSTNVPEHMMIGADALVPKLRGPGDEPSEASTLLLAAVFPWRTTDPWGGVGSHQIEGFTQFSAMNDHKQAAAVENLRNTVDKIFTIMQLDPDHRRAVREDSLLSDLAAMQAGGQPYGAWAGVRNPAEAEQLLEYMVAQGKISASAVEPLTRKWLQVHDGAIRDARLLFMAEHRLTIRQADDRLHGHNLLFAQVSANVQGDMASQIRAGNAFAQEYDIYPTQVTNLITELSKSNDIDSRAAAVQAFTGIRDTVVHETIDNMTGLTESEQKHLELAVSKFNAPGIGRTAHTSIQEAAREIHDTRVGRGDIERSKEFPELKQNNEFWHVNKNEGVAGAKYEIKMDQYGNEEFSEDSIKEITKRTRGYIRDRLGKLSPLQTAIWERAVEPHMVKNSDILHHNPDFRTFWHTYKMRIKHHKIRGAGWDQAVGYAMEEIWQSGQWGFNVESLGGEFAYAPTGNLPAAEVVGADNVEPDQWVSEQVADLFLQQLDPVVNAQGALVLANFAYMTKTGVTGPVETAPWSGSGPGQLALGAYKEFVDAVVWANRTGGHVTEWVFSDSTLEWITGLEQSPVEWLGTAPGKAQLWMLEGVQENFTPEVGLWDALENFGKTWDRHTAHADIEALRSGDPSQRGWGMILNRLGTSAAMAGGLTDPTMYSFLQNIAGWSWVKDIVDAQTGESTRIFGKRAIAEYLAEHPEHDPEHGGAKLGTSIGGPGGISQQMLTVLPKRVQSRVPGKEWHDPATKQRPNMVTPPNALQRWLSDIYLKGDPFEIRLRPYRGHNPSIGQHVWVVQVYSDAASGWVNIHRYTNGKVDPEPFLLMHTGSETDNLNPDTSQTVISARAKGARNEVIKEARQKGVFDFKVDTPLDQVLAPMPELIPKLRNDPAMKERFINELFNQYLRTGYTPALLSPGTPEPALGPAFMHTRNYFKEKVERLLE